MPLASANVLASVQAFKGAEKFVFGRANLPVSPNQVLPIAIRHSLSVAFPTCRFADLTICQKIWLEGVVKDRDLSRYIL